MHPVKRILVPVDFSECSHAAVEWATLLALRFDAAVDVLHVWSVSVLESWTPYEPDGVDRHLIHLEQAEAGNSMKEILTRLEQAGVPAHGRVDSGDPLHTILRVAADGEYDVIVMGTHGRTGLTHLLLGSVAESVVRRAPCPVLTIRQHRQKEQAIRASAV
jgi:nucleotide-binding universal stress UspA family protein